MSTRATALCGWANDMDPRVQRSHHRWIKLTSSRWGQTGQDKKERYALRGERVHNSVETKWSLTFSGSFRTVYKPLMQVPVKSQVQLQGSFLIASHNPACTHSHTLPHRHTHTHTHIHTNTHIYVVMSHFTVSDLDCKQCPLSSQWSFSPFQV